MYQPRKTICDKVSRLVKLSYNEDAAALLAKHIRDVYDLSALYHNQEYNDYLHSEDFLDAMYRVTIEDGLNKNSRSHLSLADAPIFKDAEAVMALPEVATAYTTDLKKLTFDKRQDAADRQGCGSIEEPARNISAFCKPTAPKRQNRRTTVKTTSAVLHSIHYYI